MMVWLTNAFENMLDFSNILNMSIVASWMVLAVIVLRFLLKKTPKWIHVALWGLVAVRLMLPFSVESVFSLIPSAQTVPQEIVKYEGVHLETPAYLDVVSNPIFFGGISVELEQTVDRVQVHLVNMTFVWILGITIMILYMVVSYWKLLRKVETAVLYKNNIFQSEYVNSPFVLGIIKPKIYLPFDMNEQDMKYVIAHEQAHIQRMDHWWKPLGFLLLTVHWFNPVIWLGYILFCRDIELACDEKVIKELSAEQRADYSEALLTCSVNSHMIAACPLAFGEVGVKDRVKSVLNYKQSALGFVLLAIVVTVIFAVCFLTNPMDASESIINKILKLDGEYEVIQVFEQKVTLSIPVSKLPEQVFSEEGLVYDKEDVIAYQDSTTTIYLKEAKYANEGMDKLYFCFDFAFDLPKKASDFFYPYIVRESGLSNAIVIGDGSLRADNGVYENAVAVRGQGPDNQIWFYVSKEALRQAEGTVSFDISLNRIKYSSAHVVETIQGNLITYYKMNDGSWSADGHTYKYRLKISGRTPKAIKDSTFVYLSNLENISFEQAWKAAGLSSNTEDYFDVEEAVLVEWNVE